MAVTENVSSCSLSAMWDWSHLSLSGTPPAETLLDAATDLLVLDRNFTGSLELCERGLQIISTEPRDGNVLLYSRVLQPHVMLDLGRHWLRAHVSRPSPWYKRVAELHLLNILLPLGLFAEAEDLARDPRVFSKQQQEVAINAVREEKRRLEQEEEKDREEERERQSQERTVSPKGNVGVMFAQVVRLISGALTWMRRVPLRPALLALLLLSVILLRLDPASPASRGPLSRLLLLLRQVFNG